MQVNGQKLVTLERICTKYASVRQGKVAYLFARNNTIISGPLTDMRNVTKPTEAIEAFNKARQELAREFADRDENGTPVQEVNKKTGQAQFRISRWGAFVEATEKLLLEKFPQAKADQEMLDQKAKDILEEPIELEFFKMPLSKIPGYRNEQDGDNGILESADLTLLLELGIVYDEEETKNNVTELVPQQPEA